LDKLLLVVPGKSESSFNLTWAKWMSEAQSGQKEAYSRLLSEISPPILGYIRKKLSRQQGNSGVADDLLQNVLLKIHVSRQTFDPSQAFEPWMYAITRNVINDHYRREGRQAHLSLREGDHFPEIGEQGGALDALALEQAINNLNNDQRTAFKLLQLSGLSMEEAAKKIGVSVSAMKVRAHRAYKSISASLNPGEPDQKK